MPRAAEVHIGTRHGEACTCHKLDPITLQPVIVSDDCPGRLREHFSTVAKLFEPKPFEPKPFAGRIIISWPAPTDDGTPLHSRPMQIHDYDTGEPLDMVTGLRIELGGTQWRGESVEAFLTMLVGEDGLPLAAATKPKLDEHERVRTDVFRYAVVEMRAKDSAR